MNDVAREAGVGLKTVSRYVNGETNINPELTARIGAAIAKLGYRRNLVAASIRPGWTSKILGLVISDLANPYYSMLTRVIEETARQRGYLLVSASSEEDGSIHDHVIDRLIEHRVAGLIVVPPRTAGRPWSAVHPPIPPLVILDRPVEADAEIILADNAGGAREATATLVRNGARRIAFVGDQLGLYTMSERLSGYAEALREAGIAHDMALVDDSAHSVGQAAEAVRSMLERDEPEAIFAANNRASIGALLAFRELGRRVPIIGFDDFEAAPLAQPAVSVVRQNIEEMGRLAVEMVMRPRRADAVRTHMLPTALVLRGSELATAQAR